MTLKELISTLSGVDLFGFAEYPGGKTFLDLYGVCTDREKDIPPTHSISESRVSNIKAVSNINEDQIGYP